MHNAPWFVTLVLDLDGAGKVTRGERRETRPLIRIAGVVYAKGTATRDKHCPFVGEVIVSRIVDGLLVNGSPEVQL